MAVINIIVRYRESLPLATFISLESDIKSKLESASLHFCSEFSRLYNAAKRYVLPSLVPRRICHLRGYVLPRLQRKLNYIFAAIMT